MLWILKSDNNLIIWRHELIWKLEKILGEKLKIWENKNSREIQDLKILNIKIENWNFGNTKIKFRLVSSYLFIPFFFAEYKYFGSK